MLDHPKPGAWVDEGFGLAGTHGVPSLIGTGAVVGGDKVTLRLTDTLENAPGFLVVGLSSQYLPFAGGTLVPTFDLLRIVQTDLAGALTVQGVWPKGVPSGFQAWYHYWLLDPVGVQGFAASNGRQSITQ